MITVTRLTEVKRLEVEVEAAKLYEVLWKMHRVRMLAGQSASSIRHGIGVREYIAADIALIGHGLDTLAAQLDEARGLLAELTELSGVERKPDAA